MSYCLYKNAKRSRCPVVDKCIHVLAHVWFDLGHLWLLSLAMGVSGRRRLRPIEVC